MTNEIIAQKKICTIDGCDKSPRKGGSICAMHYHRHWRNGSYSVKPRTIRKVISNGYVMFGADRLHRIVYKQHHGDSIPPCWNCGAPLSWDMGKAMHIDHINNDRADNRIENLRASCWRCNIRRTKKASGGPKLTAIGITQSLMEWSRHPQVCVSQNTIRHRLKRGFSHHDALFAEKKTHRYTEQTKQLLKAEER